MRAICGAYLCCGQYGYCDTILFVFVWWIDFWAYQPYEFGFLHAARTAYCRPRNCSSLPYINQLFAVKRIQPNVWRESPSGSSVRCV